MKYQIKDNFLDKNQFNNLKNILMSEELPWFWKENMTKNDNYFFNHCFYNHGCPQSNLFVENINPILKKLECKAIIEIRANLMLKKELCYNSNFHCDKSFDCKTAILYMNTNNGKTVFEEKKLLPVNSVENRIVIFPSHLKHAGTTHTDTDFRLVLNINYY
jgi:hypothetical protein